MSAILLRALRGEATERRPAWIMRQAGRYLPARCARDIRSRSCHVTRRSPPK